MFARDNAAVALSTRWRFSRASLDNSRGHTPIKNGKVRRGEAFLVRLIQIGRIGVRRAARYRGSGADSDQAEMPRLLSNIRYARKLVCNCWTTGPGRGRVRAGSSEPRNHNKWMPSPSSSLI